MNREPSPVLRTPNRRHRRHVDDMTEVLAQMQTSESIHFVKALPRTAIPQPGVRQTAKLSLPTPFVRENGDNIGEFITLRVQTSTGRSSQSWIVRVYVPVTLRDVQLVGGWPAFVADNRLKKGDYVLFVLREDASSEFEVHLFRGPNASPYFPDEGERQSDEDEEEGNDSSDSEFEEEKTNNQSPVHQQDSEHNEIFTRDYMREGNALVPRFSKRLVASNIGRSASKLKSGQFQFPAHFIRNHGERIHDSVKLQGIHENSRSYVINCQRRPRNLVKAYFTPTEWSRFVEDNDLKEGQVLQFSLMADSYFVVRKISQTCHCGFRTLRTRS